MENQQVNEAVELKNAIDASIETKATEATETAVAKSAEAIEAKATELTAALEAKNLETAELLQKEIDDLKSEVKSLNIKETPKMENTLKSWLDSNVEEVINNKNASAVYELKNASSYSPSAGVASAPYADDRQSEIEFDPYEMTLAGFIQARTGTGGAYRLSTGSTSTDGSNPKAKGAAFGQTTLAVADQHNPYITVGHVLTVPKEELNDTVAIESYFRENLSDILVEKINDQILRGTGGTANINGIESLSAPKDQAAFETFFGSDLADTYGTTANRIDVLNAASLALEGDNFMGKKMAFVHPSTIANIQGIKATDGHYILNSAVDPTGKVRMFLGNIEVISNAAVDAGEFYIFDSSALKWVTREGMQVEMGYTGDDWQRNNVSLKVYGRYALVSGKPNGIANGTFADAILALNAG